MSESRGEPTAAGLEARGQQRARSRSPSAASLTIDSMVSHAYALFPAEPGEVQTTAVTVLRARRSTARRWRSPTGASRSPTRARARTRRRNSTSRSAKALSRANIADIRLAEATTKVDEDGLVKINAGMLVVEYRNNEFGGANPHGFSGGGFSVGGASLSIEAIRATAATTSFRAQPAAHPDRFMASAMPGRKDPEQT